MAPDENPFDVLIEHALTERAAGRTRSLREVAADSDPQRIVEEMMPDEKNRQILYDPNTGRIYRRENDELTDTGLEFLMRSAP